MNALLMIQRNGQLLRSQPLEAGELVVGRGEGCPIRLEDRAVSRQHAILRSSESGLSIERKTPLAPLWVNGNECDAALLKEGDEIHIGPFLLKIALPQPELRAEVVEAPSQPQTPKVDSGFDVPIASVTPGSDSSAALAVESAPGIPDLNAIPEQSAESSGSSDPVLSLGGQSLALDSASELDVSILSDVQSEVGEDAKTSMIGAGSVKLRIRAAPGSANLENAEFDQDEVSIGRGKGCDIVLNDKKASRKHAVIRRSGQGSATTYVVVDLQSANGTYVNGARVTEHTLAGDDIVRIGEVELVVQAVSPGFEARSEKFLKVEDQQAIHEDPAEEAGLFGAVQPVASLPQLGGISTPGAGAYPSVDPAPSSTAFSSVSGIAGINTAGGRGKGSLLDSFNALPTGQKVTRGLIAVMVVVLGVSTLTEDPEGSAKKKQSPKQQATNVPAQVKPQGASGSTMPSFAELKPELQKFVDSQYNLAMEYYRNRDFDNALEEVEKIFRYTAEYKDATDLKRYSIEGKQRVQAQEEERKRKEAEKQVREKVAQLVLEIEGHMNRKEYDRAKEYFAQVITLDPENTQIVEWKKIIQEHEEEVKKAELTARLARETNDHAREIIEEGDARQKSSKWLEAVERYESALALGATDKKLVARARSGIEKARVGLKDAIDPLIAEGREAEAEGNFTKAFKAYGKAQAIDPRGRDAFEGIQRIKGIIGEQVKNLYTEGVLAESYSDFAGAKAKFEEILQTAPKDDPYYDRARRRLMKYVIREGAKVE